MGKSKKSTRTKTKRETAEALELQVDTIDGYVRAGAPHDPPKKRGGPILLDPLEVRAWMLKTGRTGAPGRPRATDLVVQRKRHEAEVAQRHGVPEAPSTPTPTPPVPGQDEPPKGDDPVEELIRKRALSEAKKVHWDAIKAQVQALREQGKVLDIDEVTAAWGEEGARMRATFLALPARIGPRLVGLPEAQLTLELERGVREALLTLAGKAPGATPEEAAEPSPPHGT